MAERDIQAELDTLREDLSVLRRDVGALLKALRDTGAEQAVEAGNNVKEEAMHRMEQIKEAFGSAKDAGRRLCKQAHRKLGDKPVTSVLAAFAVGVVIGRLLHTCRKGC